ncbi:MAG: PLP-dependent aspartate aminotransferase family protein [Phycisphaerae bacterium]
MPPRFETLCVHHAERRGRYEGAAAPPIFQTSTFTHAAAADFDRRTADDYAGFDYTRTANPTTTILEEKIAALEHGEAARAFGSGMAAISAAILSCVKSGDHISAVDTAYGPTRSLLNDFMPRYDIRTTYVPGTRVDDFAQAVRPETRLVFLETPSSLVFAIQDLDAVCRFARSRKITTICDNSYATPYFQRPLALGVDLVVHTATKYIGGHSDVVAGLAVGARERIAAMSKVEGQLLGGVLDPFAAWLLLRGLRTLAIRLERHQASALTIAKALEKHAKVARVFHPGLETHPDYDVARHQMAGTSGMLSFVLTDDQRDAAHRFVDALQYFGIAVSWGGYESLVIPIRLKPPGAAQGRWGARLSVGLEHVDDLLEDVHAALDAV